MASQESYYTSPSVHPAATAAAAATTSATSSSSSPVTSTPPGPLPPPPPPKPSFSQEASRTGTPATPSIPIHQPASQSNPFPRQQVQQQPPPPPPLQQQFQQQQQQNQYQQIPPPSKSEQWLPESLSQHSITDLQALLAEPELVNAWAQSHPSFGSSTEPVTALLQANAGLARQLAALEAQVRQLRHDTAQALLNHTSLQTQWRRKQREMDDALSPWGPRAMYQRLVSSIAEQEALLAATTDSFLDVSLTSTSLSPSPDNAYYHSDGPASRLASDKEVVDWLRRVREGTATLEKRREMRARWDEGRVGGWR